MIAIYFKTIAGFAFAFVALVTCIHSFNVSEQAQADDMSINRYGED